MHSKTARELIQWYLITHAHMLSNRVRKFFRKLMQEPVNTSFERACLREQLRQFVVNNYRELGDTQSLTQACRQLKTDAAIA